MGKIFALHIHVIPLLFIIGLLLYSVVFAQSQTVTFSRNLTIGSSGADVFELQKILNLSPKTRLANDGPGAPGEETTYFGPLTRAAVIKYQNLYASEILFPLGLSLGTGFFGPSTREKINKAHLDISDTIPPTAGEEEIAASPTQASTIPTFTGSTQELQFYYTSPQDGRPGEMLTIFGTGFTGAENSVHFNETVLSNIPSMSGTELTFAIPELAAGRYALSISNQKGKVDARYFRILNENSVSPPKIISISPTHGKQDTIVTVFGSNFSTEENLIYTTFDEITNVASSDGKTISFTVPPLPSNTDSGVGTPSAAEIAEADKKSTATVTQLPLFIYVENNDGISNEAVFLIDDF
jgi:hypothetical protein